LFTNYKAAHYKTFSCQLSLTETFVKLTSDSQPHLGLPHLGFVVIFIKMDLSILRTDQIAVRSRNFFGPIQNFHNIIFKFQYKFERRFLDIKI